MTLNLNQSNRSRKFYTFLSYLNEFFKKKGFLEIYCPPVVNHPGMETHIHPFELYSTKNIQQLSPRYYLNTSPEFYMKKMLSEDLKNIFTLTYSFREEPASPIHRFQFLMLEWYRAQCYYVEIMNDVECLMNELLSKIVESQVMTLNPIIHKILLKNNQLTSIKFNRMTIQNLFLELTNLDPLQFLDQNDFYQKIKLDFPEIPLPERQLLSYDDLFFLFFLNKIEPFLINYPFLILYEYPRHLAALSTFNKVNPLVCERFEIYVNGIELGNAFNELIDYNEQFNRYKEHQESKKVLYGYDLGEPTVLLKALKQGLPPSAGIAMGVERLFSVLTGEHFFAMDN